MSKSARLYTRDLPGGGRVTIESLPVEEGIHRARLTVERRTDPMRRDGHIPPVIATAEGPTEESVYQELLRIAADNVAVAQCIMRWQARR